MAKEQKIGSLSQQMRYSYTPGGKLKQVQLPSGKLIDYGYTKGILTTVTVDGTLLINNISYDPNGITGFTWAQTGETVSYTHDLDGRLTNLADPALKRNYLYDAGNRITNITDTKANLNYSYVHDKLDRLLKQSLSQTQGKNELSYLYDANSNRTTKTHKTGTMTDIQNTAIESTSNKLTKASYDSAGNVLNDGVRSYDYNSLGRVRKTQRGSAYAIHVYNGLNQRVIKTTVNKTVNKTYFVYDEQGKLTGEYSKNGDVKREYVYLGNIPVGMFSSEKPQELLQIHTDHLGTPRAVTSKDKTILWRWEGDQFGTSSPQIETIKLPLRHAGQYHDSETGLFYNWHRFYIPELGRYNRVDPLGLTDGTNPFNYVAGTPLHAVDPDGRLLWLLAPLAVGGGGAAAGTGVAVGGGWGASLGGLAIAGGIAGALSLAFGGDDAGDSASDNTDNECNNDDKCKAIYGEIEGWIYVVKTERYDELLIDRYRLYRNHRSMKRGMPGVGSWEGHIEKYNDAQDKLKDAIFRAKLQQCYNYNKDADYWANQPPPNKPLNP